MRDSQATNPRAESFSKQHPRKHKAGRQDDDKSLELEAISLTHRFCADLLGFDYSSQLSLPTRCPHHHHTPRPYISIFEFCISSLRQLIITATDLSN